MESQPIKEPLSRFRRSSSPLPLIFGTSSYISFFSFSTTRGLRLRNGKGFRFRYSLPRPQGRCPAREIHPGQACHWRTFMSFRCLAFSNRIPSFLHSMIHSFSRRFSATRFLPASTRRPPLLLLASMLPEFSLVPTTVFSSSSVLAPYTLPSRPSSTPSF